MATALIPIESSIMATIRAPLIDIITTINADINSTEIVYTAIVKNRVFEFTIIRRFESVIRLAC